MAVIGNLINSTTGKPLGPILIIGRVKRVVLGPYLEPSKLPDPYYSGPNDIGAIKFEILYTSLSTSLSDGMFPLAYPVNSFSHQYPVENEIVLVVPGPTEGLNDRQDRQKYFYFPPYDLWNNVNNGAFPNLEEYEKFLSDFANKPEYSGQSTPAPKFPLGRTFKEKTVKKLKPFEGDTVLQARFGQSIRFGSTNRVLQDFNTWSEKGETGDPITVILNSQRAPRKNEQLQMLVEDVNKDGSSIIMTSTQQINLDISGFPLKSFETTIPQTTQPVIQTPALPISNRYFSAGTQDLATINSQTKLYFESGSVNKITE